MTAVRGALRVGLAAVVVALTLHGAPRAQAAGPSFTMFPTSGSRTSIISVTGRDWTGFAAVQEIVFLQFGSDEEINGANGRPGSGALSAIATPKDGAFELDLNLGQYKGSCTGGGCQLCLTDNTILPICQPFTLAVPPGGSSGSTGSSGACPANPDATLTMPASHLLAPGQSAPYSAGGFQAGAQVTVQLTTPAGGSSGPPLRVTVDGSCAIQTTITVPPDAQPGTYALTATGSTPSGGTRTWTTSFQVAGPAQAPAAPPAPAAPARPSTGNAPDFGATLANLLDQAAQEYKSSAAAVGGDEVEKDIVTLEVLQLIPQVFGPGDLSSIDTTAAGICVSGLSVSSSDKLASCYREIHGMRAWADPRALLFCAAEVKKIFSSVDASQPDTEDPDLYLAMAGCVRLVTAP